MKKIRSPSFGEDTLDYFGYIGKKEQANSFCMGLVCSINYGVFIRRTLLIL